MLKKVTGKLGYDYHVSIPVSPAILKLFNEKNGFKTLSSTTYFEPGLSHSLTAEELKDKQDLLKDFEGIMTPAGATYTILDVSRPFLAKL